MLCSFETELQTPCLSLYNLPVRILLLNLYYPPDTSATAKMAAGVSAALAERHDVTILCGRPSYDPTERRPWKLWQTERPSAKVTVIRVGSTAFPRFRMIGRVLNYLSYSKLSVLIALFIPCDLVLAMTDPPFEGIVGAVVALLKRKPYLYNIRDLYPDMALGGALILPGLLGRLWERMHRWALRRATRLIVLGEDMRERITGKGVDPARVAVVRDGAEIPVHQTTEVELDPAVISKTRGSFRFVLLHAGNLGFYGAWETLIEAARELEKDGISLVFVGEGAERPRLEERAADLKNVRFLPFFPAGKIASVLAAGDAHLVTVKRGLEGLVVPSKLYGILAAGRPVVVVAPDTTDAARIIRGHRCGIVCDPDHPKDLAAAVRELASNPERLHEMSSAARAIAPEYDRARELRRFVEIAEAAGRA